MRARIVLLVTAIVCWVWSVTLIAMATQDYRPADDWRHLFLWWGIWWALAGQVPTFALIVDHYAEKNRESHRDVADFTSQVRGQVRHLN